jgi:ferredoxin--NADP+ reductase
MDIWLDVRRKTNSVSSDMTRQPAPDRLKEYLLTRHDEIAPGVYVIGFERPFDFRPGQAVKLAVDGDHPPRIYSICSGTADEELCVLFNIKPDGFLTPRLAQLKAGDSIFASAPCGTFLGTDEPAWWIAAGTGIAPFRSMLRSGLGSETVLLHGARGVNQFYFADEFAAALGDRYHRCCSADTAPQFFAGRVTGFLARQDTLPADCPYYVCGQALMAVETRDLLIKKEIPFDHILTEIYF